MTRPREFLRLLSLLLIGFGSLQNPAAYAQQRWDFSILPYRTEISPGTPEEDALFVSRLVPELAKAMFGELTGEGLVYETIDIFVDRKFAREKNGAPIRNAAGKVAIESDVQFTIRGERFYAATLTYLKWRQAFEQKWIHDASPENVKLEPTPLQLIQREPRLSSEQKVLQTLLFYTMKTREASNQQPEIPDPDYWPVSPVFDIDSVGVQVQFNIRGGLVTVLHADSNRVWQLPFPSIGSCDRWMSLYERAAKDLGLERAAEKMREEVRNW
ncbi:MAG: hypothetical protein KC931_11365 [Candidatus Omnitrophica bacterium]|nr:hypothetical protein [Candidatus Omnitrophota bacterium]MCA9425976.1 hypothetical protein [Candidatus Omnitrophota bacterium]MCA9434553.1 hypothetical protein [Candidatus Omnitrophota bacterium]MCA9447707.1 hypothetical protein [Candidatus Omnitrophota bacterium]